MKIYNSTNIEILDILVDDNSLRYRSIMQDNSLTLNFSTIGPVTVPVGSYVEFEGQRYTLYYPENFKKHNTRNFEYTLVLHGNQEAMKLYKFKDMSAKPYRLKFPLTAKPADFLQLLVDNMNINDSGWTKGDCIEADEKVISFNHEYCYDVLNRLASEFNTEWEVEGKTIHLRKVEKFKADPLPLSYGKGNGFKSGVGRQNDGDKQPIGRLYVQGGERNIDYSTYGSQSLLLPKSAILVYDGKTYATDVDGMSITRNGNTNPAEDSYDGSDIYPKRVGTVSEVIVVDEEKNFYDIIDNSIPESLDYSDCRIAGEKATIVFQSGALAGREFDIQQTDTSLTGYNHEERKFQIVPAELDGFVMPGGVFVPEVGDKYAIFNISMPQAYISDDATSTGASWDMFREAVTYFASNEDAKFIFHGELDGVWSRDKWLEIGGKIVPGGYVLFSDPQFQPEGIPIRITGIKDYINKPHKPEITLSNAPISASFSSDLGKLEAEEVVRAEDKKEVMRFTKRQWRDTIETMSMLEESLLNFSGSVNPITVQTMQLLVGDPSLQFRFVNNKTSPSQVNHSVVFNSENKVLNASADIIQHMTLGITTLKKSHIATEYKFWDMAVYTSPPLTADKSYYLYAKCAKSGTTGTFLLSESAIGMESDSTHYHFLIGILNSEYDGDRSFVTMYGFTEILPGRVTTDKIVSQDGKTYFDLVNGVISGKIRFLNSENEYEDIEDIEVDVVTFSLGIPYYEFQKNEWGNVISETIEVPVVITKNGQRQTILPADYVGFSSVPGLNINASATKTSTVNITATPSLTLPTGTATIIVKIDNKNYVAIFNYKLVNEKGKDGKDGKDGIDGQNGKDGQDGSDGSDGDDGVSVVSVAEQWYLSNSANSQIGGTWLDTIPEWTEGKTIWQRFKITFSNGTFGYTTPQKYSAAEALQKVNIAKAITDKFGTTIDGALINTVMMLLREANTTKVTAGISGIQGENKDNPAFWSGGEYEDAIALIEFLYHVKNETPAGTGNNQFNYAGKYEALAPVSILHSGASKVGDLIVTAEGRVMVVDPATGKERLTIHTLPIPDVATLISGVDFGDDITNAQITSSVDVTLPYTLNVDKNDADIRFTASQLTFYADLGNNNQLDKFIGVDIQLYRDGTLVETVAAVVTTGTTGLVSGVQANIDVTLRKQRAGIYSIRAKFQYAEPPLNKSFTLSASKLEWTFRQANVRRQEYGLNGMMFFYSNNHHHFTEANGLDIRGKTNMPGVLAKGRVLSSGSRVTGAAWGDKNSTSTITKPSGTGSYRVPVNCPNGNYDVDVTPRTANRTVYVGVTTSTYFDVYFRDHNGNVQDSEFSYTLVGSNY